MALASSSVYVVEQAPQNGYYQCLCPQAELQLLPASPGGSPRSAGGSDLLLRVLEHVRFLCVPFKSGVSISLSPLGLPKVSPAGLQGQILWEFVSPMEDSWSGKPNMGLEPLTPLGEPLQL